MRRGPEHDRPSTARRPRPSAALPSRMPAPAWAARRRRASLSDDGRLLLIAADHPARGALAVRDDARAMASRPVLLERLATALQRPGVDGVLGTPDVLEDLLLSGLLDDKVVVGSMNRGGLQGAVFELDDRFTAYDADTIAANGLDGGKMLTASRSTSPAPHPRSRRAGTPLPRSPATACWPWSSRS